MVLYTDLSITEKLYTEVNIKLFHNGFVYRLSVPSMLRHCYNPKGTMLRRHWYNPKGTMLRHWYNPKGTHLGWLFCPRAVLDGSECEGAVVLVGAYNLLFIFIYRRT